MTVREDYKAALMDVIRAGFEDGKSDAEIAALIGYSRHFVGNKRRGMRLLLAKGRRVMRTDPARLQLIAERLRTGDTLQTIADQLGLTRERVRQLAKKTNSSARCGMAVRGIATECERERVAALKRARAERKCQKTMGCSLEELAALNDGKARYFPGSRGNEYIHWKNNLRKLKAGPVEITFPQWCKLWEESGKWQERGRGFGYWMARKDRTKPFTIDNVHIVTGSAAIEHHRNTAPWKTGYAKKENSDWII